MSQQAESRRESDPDARPVLFGTGVALSAVGVVVGVEAVVSLGTLLWLLAVALIVLDLVGDLAADLGE